MAHGVPAFEYMRGDPEFSRSFNSAVSFYSSVVTEKILERYTGFQDVRVLVDVGGGRGTTLNMIVSKYPHIRGINFDLPQVIGDAPPFDGIEHVGGDMFQGVPRGQAILLKVCVSTSNGSVLTGSRSSSMDLLMVRIFLFFFISIQRGHATIGVTRSA